MKLHIKNMIYGGAGVAQVVDASEGDGEGEILIPFVLTGELVETSLPDEGRGVLSYPVSVVQHISPHRVSPRCRHFGSCGGCQYQHVEYEAQLAIKAGILRQTFEQAGLLGLPGIQTHASGPWNYRNRIRLRVAEHQGELHVGYSRRAIGEFLPIEECPIAAPLLWRAAEALCELGGRGGEILKNAVEVELFCDAAETKLQVSIFVRNRKTKGLGELCKLLKEKVPELAGGGLALLKGQSGGGRRMQATEVLANFDRPGLSYSVGSREYWVARGGFFQVNRFLVEEMLKLVTGGRSGGLAWDLYAGVGLFSRVLAENFAQVVAVEGGEVAGEELVRAMRKLSQNAVNKGVAEFLRDAVVQRERPDLVVADPPRAGLGEEVSGLLARVAAKEMVYVSCDPETLARDLKILVDSGYRITQVHLLDMFPQTFHIETVVFVAR